MQSPLPMLLTVTETARRLKVSKATIYRLASETGADALPIHRIGGSIRVHPGELNRWLEEHSNATHVKGDDAA